MRRDMGWAIRLRHLPGRPHKHWVCGASALFGGVAKYCQTFLLWVLSRSLKWFVVKRIRQGLSSSSGLFGVWSVDKQLHHRNYDDVNVCRVIFRISRPATLRGIRSDQRPVLGNRKRLGLWIESGQALWV